ncbi:hypothetical protein PCANC_04518 [Puccinia coronata f. sp. avenae]|uniref:Uncharacterized protein n=1 Tax=Puccinia coronata f. sp. avenae TaxID=200324 RepID=A0A2N5VW87_9BASI|nr:hypothetical protein PCANC_04518 [Puccinia coronata f. sp. avenae]
MTTRRQAGDDLHALVADPEAILRARNQEHRRQHQLDKLKRHLQASLAAREARSAESRIPLPSSPTLRPASPQRSKPIPATSSLATPDPPRPNTTDPPRTETQRHTHGESSPHRIKHWGASALRRLQEYPLINGREDPGITCNIEGRPAPDQGMPPCLDGKPAVSHSAGPT